MQGIFCERTIDICLERNIYRHSWRCSFKGQSGPVFSKLWLSVLGVWTLYRAFGFVLNNELLHSLSHPGYKSRPFMCIWGPSWFLQLYFTEHIIWFHNCKPSHRHVRFPPCMLSMRFVFKFLICNSLVNISLLFSCPIKLIILSSLHMIVMQYYIYIWLIYLYLSYP